MLRLRNVGLAFVALVALSALVASAASAALPEFSPATANKFSGSGGAGELTTLGGGISIKCSANTSNGEITGAKTANVDVHFTGCTALGFTSNSLGDASGVILTGSLPAELCYINAATKEVGVFISNANTHIEVPSLGVLIIVSGSIIGKVTPVNVKTTKFTFKFEQSAAGDQKVTECGGKKASLVSNKDAAHEKNESSAIVQSAEVTAEKEVTIVA